MAAQQTESKTVRLEELSNGSSDDALAAARELLLDYGRFVIAQPGAARFCFGSLEREAARLPLSYREQAGGCLMAFVDNTPTGFVAWRDLAPSPQVAADAWELKRLWVRPSGRGLGLGRALTSLRARSGSRREAKSRLSRYSSCIHGCCLPHLSRHGVHTLRCLQ